MASQQRTRLRTNVPSRGQILPPLRFSRFTQRSNYLHVCIAHIHTTSNDNNIYNICMHATQGTTKNQKTIYIKSTHALTPQFVGPPPSMTPRFELPSTA